MLFNTRCLFFQKHISQVILLCGTFL